MEMSHMYEKVVSVLSAHPHARQEKDINILVPWFKLKSDIFKKLKTETLKDIIRNCEFREFEPDHVIIRQGDEGHSFYIILRGTVSIYIKYTNDDDSDDGDTEALNDDREGHRERGGGRGAAADTTDYTEAVKTKLNRTVYGSYIRTLDSAGLSFGELALIKKSNTRNASVISDSKMHVIIVNKDLYSRSLQLSQQKDLEERTSFVDTYPLFRDWRPRYRSMLAMSLRRTTIEFNNNLVRQGDPVNALYFIMGGLAIMSTDTSLHRQQYRDKLGAGIVRPKYGRRSMSKTYSSRSVYGASNRIDLCVLGKGDIAGDIELILKIPTNMQTIRCIEKVEVYELDLKYYDKLIHRKNPGTLNIIQRLAEIKIEHRLSRIPKDVEAPMLKWALTRLREINTKDKTPNSEETQNKKLNLWMTGRRPVVDRTGPGSLLYRLRHVEKQLTRKRRQRQQRTVNDAGFQIRSVNNPSSDVFKPTDDSEVSKEVDQLNAHYKPTALSSFINLPNTLDLQLPKLSQRDYSQEGNTNDDSEQTNGSVNSISESLSDINIHKPRQHKSFPLIIAIDGPSSREEVVNRSESQLSESGYSSNPTHSWNDDQPDRLKLLSSLRGSKLKSILPNCLDETASSASILTSETTSSISSDESSQQFINRKENLPDQQDAEPISDRNNTIVRNSSNRRYTVSEYTILKEALRRRQKRHTRYLESVWSPQ
ncbi:uncharacterized protein [Antedon mediterranea]|uniref:uncharacterized protein n=1 Tax=Antedon mediterranea TaxID=105859 RepID=UPI003AF70384